MKLTNYHLTQSYLAKTRGLMFSTKKTLVFPFTSEQRVPLHTFFVFFSITVLFLDSRKRIIEHKIMRPFSFYYPRQKAKYIIELPFTTQKKMGERICF